MTMHTKDASRFHRVVSSAAEQLVSLEQISDGIYVTTPLMYSSGAYVVVSVEQADKSYLVSDFGAGFQEAEFIAANAMYRRVAKNVASASGVRFDGHAFFAMLPTADQLPGAVAAIANSSQEAVNVTSLKMAERTHRDDNEALYDRLTSIFSRREVKRGERLVGASNTEWRVSALVIHKGCRVAFEAVTKHPNSVVYAATKFGDIARMKRAPGRVAVVNSTNELGTYLNVLSHSASVIEHRVDDNVYQSCVQEAA